MKKTIKNNREFQILLGVVNHYLKTGKPVGSNTLKETGFENVSSATIRNYFANLEETGYLIQQHSSGGRIPTHLAFRTYANEFIESHLISSETEKLLQTLRGIETREIAAFLQEAAESLGAETGCAIFLSAPRFDQDFIVNLRLVEISPYRCVCVIVTDFGVVRTEILQLDVKLSAFGMRRIEAYFNWRITGKNKPEDLKIEEEQLAQKLYNEVVIRYLVGYSNFVESDLYRTGFSRLLCYPEFHHASELATTLSLFENTQQIKLLIKECCKANALKFWIGDDLSRSIDSIPNCAVVTHPYYINQSVAGAIGILGPARMPYQRIFGTIKAFSSCVSEVLTRNLYKFKISFRQPNNEVFTLSNQEHLLLAHLNPNTLEK